MSFVGKRVLITGATSGIGKTTALAFAAAGASVVVAGRREAEGASVVSEIVQAKGKGFFVRADVAKEADVKNLVEQAEAKLGGLDIAVNNAGVEFSAPITEFQQEDYRRIFDINVLGVFLSLKYEIPAILRSGGGAIVNVSSIAGHIGLPGVGIYVASKHAVEGITKVAALEHAKANLRINAVAPGAIVTDMILRFTGGTETEAAQQLAHMHPIGRMGHPDEIASAILYLASDAASFITGVSLPIDGGFIAR